MNSDVERNEEVRRAAMEVLGPRHPCALPPGAILRRFEIEKLVDGVKATPGELVAALALLEELELVEKVPSQIGAGTCWKATAAGVLKWERGEI